MFGLPFRSVAEITGDATPRAELPTSPQYIDIFRSISTITHPSLDKTEQCGTSEGESCDHNDGGPSDDAPEENEGLTLIAVKEILLQVVASYYILRTLTACTSTATFASKYLPFMNSVLSALNPPFIPSPESALDEHKKRLTNSLTSWNFRSVSTPGDGNCLFHSVAFALQQQSQQGNDSICQVLSSLGINLTSQSTAEVITALRKAVVDEWLGDNSKEYQSFLTYAQLEKEACRFLKSGEFAGEIGDLVITALAHVLQSPIVLFTSIDGLPIVVIMPTQSPVANIHPLFMAYNQYGSGHFDGVVWKNPDEDDGDGAHAEYPQHCNCGRGGPKGTPCNLQLNQYSTRCPCYNRKLQCSLKCRCKNCQNPFGSRSTVPSLSKTGTKRRREHYDNQQFLLKGTKAKKFMEQAGESIATGSTSSLEMIAIARIVQYVYGMDSDDWTQWSKFDEKDVHAAYKAILSLATVLNLQVPLFERSEDDIIVMMGKCAYNLEVLHQRNSWTVFAIHVNMNRNYLNSMHVYKNWVHCLLQFFLLIYGCS